jgi:uncharacterized protein (TIGR04255 family)
VEFGPRTVKSEKKQRWGSSSESAFQSPNYRRAPVIETSLAVRFATPSKWNIHVFGLLQKRLSEAFPIFEAAPPIAVSDGKIQLTFPAPAPRIRALYWSPLRDRLVQVQDNLFCMNWQKAASAAEYPRYKTLREDFLREWDTFVSLAAKAGLGPFEIGGCSVTYINKVDPSSNLDPPDLCTFLAETPDDALKLGLALAAQTTSLTLARDSQSVTYLVQPAIQVADNTRITQITLVAESKGVSPSGDDLMPGLDSAHQLLVETFEALTSSRAKEAWGKE